jgi:hypothetical protein
MEALRNSEKESKIQLQRLHEQRQLQDPWGFCREMSLGYKRFHQTAVTTTVASQPSPLYFNDSVEMNSPSASGGGYRGAKSLKSNTNVLPFSDDEDDDLSGHPRPRPRSHVLSTHADELALGSMPSRNFAAVKSSSSSAQLDSSHMPLISFFRPASGHRHTEDLDLDDYDDYDEDESPVTSVRKPSSKFPSPSKPKDSQEYDRLFCPRDINKGSHQGGRHGSGEDESGAAAHLRRVQTADGNLSKRQTVKDSTRPMPIAVSGEPSLRFQSSLAVSPTSISEKISPLSTSRLSGAPTSAHSPIQVPKPSKIPKKSKLGSSSSSTLGSGTGEAHSTVSKTDSSSPRPFSRPGSPTNTSMGILHEESSHSKKSTSTTKSRRQDSRPSRPSASASSSSHHGATGFNSSSRRVGMI